MHAAARVQPATQLHALPKSGAVASKALSILATAASAFAVISYVTYTLNKDSSEMDRIFAQQNTPEVEAARKRDLLVDTYGDPRNSLMNILGWSK
ncbi:Uu.00g012430.m01.CDS01 [Anthostomella pinea]|uniref:Uu.00g012430.m01.CDS01 n=1 Tax=Anthostomella pinea TaxID=933095 RepID=A0AAI8VYM1_9PEZI|nr:Uu.00g012430.m01.CDS01 [Anthostomella pinea]